MTGDATVSKTTLPNVNTLTDKIQQAEGDGDKKLFVKHRLFGKNKLEVKSTGTSRAKRWISALKRREAKDKDIIKALRGAAKKDIGKLGPKAVDRYLAGKQSVKPEPKNTTADNIKDTAEVLKTLGETKRGFEKALRDKGISEQSAHSMANDVFSEHGGVPRHAAKMLEKPTTTNLLVAFANSTDGSENVKFLLDQQKADQVLDQLNKKTCKTDAQRQAVNAQKHAVYDFLIDRHLIKSGDLNLKTPLKVKAADCPIGPGTYNDQALEKKEKIVNGLRAEIATNANDTSVRLARGKRALETIEKHMDKDQITTTMSEHADGDEFFSLKLAMDEAKNRTSTLKYEFNRDGGKAMPDWANQPAPSAPKINKGPNTEGVNPAPPQPQANPTTPRAQADATPQAQGNTAPPPQTDPTTPRAQGDATPKGQTDSTSPKVQGAADTSKPDETRATSSDVSSTSQSGQKPEKDSLGTPLSEKFDHFLQSTPKVISEKIRNHPNMPQLTQNDLAELEGMIKNPDINEFAVSIRAEEMLNSK